jgi:hypothetical protein
MIYKHVSSKHAIRKVFRIFKLSASSDWVNDAVEWIGDAIQLIGTSAPLVPKIYDAQIINHRAMYPDDFFSMNAVEYNGRPLPYSNDLTIFSGQANTAKMNMRAGSEGFAYISNGIITHLESGVVRFHYEAFPIDDEGFPLIPDQIDYMEAVQWFLMRCIILSGTPHPSIDFKMADQLWVRYCTKAQNAGFPDVPKMEAFKDNFIRLIPRINLHEDFFMGQNQREGIYE